MPTPTANARRALGISNRLASITPATGPVRSFVFDANGSTTDDGTNTYAYDVRGRMVSATSGAGTTTYQVNALGQRVRKTNSSGDTVFTYDSRGHLIAESTGAGVLVKEYVWLGDMPLAVSDATGVNFIHVDHLNTPRLVANAAGTTVWKWDQQEPFGDNVADENPSGLGTFELPVAFSGQYRDKDTGIAQNGFRDYSSYGGRYVESDPLGLAGGINTYLYVGGGPIAFIDFDGLQAEDPLGFENGFTRPTASFFSLTTVTALQAGTTLNQAVQAGALFRNFTGPAIIAGTPNAVGLTWMSAPAAYPVARTTWACMAPTVRKASIVSKIIHIMRHGVPQNTLPQNPPPEPPAVVRPAPTAPKMPPNGGRIVR